MAYSSTTQQTYDLTSGQDAAYKASQERSSLQSQQMADLYGGNIPDLLSSSNRIRDLQKYLRQYGTGDNQFEVIPAVRLASVSQSTTTSDK